MVEYQTERLDAVFHALADPTRRSMLRRLAGRSLSVGDLAAPHSMSLAAASKHLKVLERAGLVTRTVQGRTHLCSLEPGQLAAADAWLSFYRHFWDNRLDVLEDLLRAPESHEGDQG